MIITRFIKSITEYHKLGKENIFPTQYGCKNCGYLGRLHRHGFYSRNVITRFTTYRIFILRIKCPSCGKTHSLLPDFLIPYYQYSFDAIFLCLYSVYILNYSYSKVVDIFKNTNSESYFSISNIYSFKKRMKEVTPIANSFFANFKEYYYDMNNPSAGKVIEKIKKFIDTKEVFNITYFSMMPKHFFAKQ
jgi:hypothetical protein